jgi:hypothetical protein
MAFTITIDLGSIPIPQIVPLGIIVHKAREIGNPQAERAIAVTIPIIRIDQRGLSYKQRVGTNGPEFSFDTGTLTLTLRQELFISNSLSQCAQKRWAIHERKHLDDNRMVMQSMEVEIRKDPWFKDVFINSKWFPRHEFDLVQRTTTYFKIRLMHHRMLAIRQKA